MSCLLHQTQLEVSTSGGLIKFSQNAAISGGPSITNHCSPLVTFKCSRSDGYGILMLALGRSHNRAFHFSAAWGQNLVSLTKEMNQQSRSDHVQICTRLTVDNNAGIQLTWWLILESNPTPRFSRTLVSRCIDADFARDFSGRIASFSTFVLSIDLSLKYRPLIRSTDNFRALSNQQCRQLLCFLCQVW